jgi:hypothetical protein
MGKGRIEGWDSRSCHAIAHNVGYLCAQHCCATWAKSCDIQTLAKTSLRACVCKKKVMVKREGKYASMDASSNEIVSVEKELLISLIIFISKVPHHRLVKLHRQINTQTYPTAEQMSQRFACVRVLDAAATRQFPTHLCDNKHNNNPASMGARQQKIANIIIAHESPSRFVGAFVFVRTFVPFLSLERLGTCVRRADSIKP